MRITTSGNRCKLNNSGLLPMYLETGKANHDGMQTVSKANDFSKGTEGIFNSVKNVKPPVMDAVTDKINLIVKDSKHTISSEMRGGKTYEGQVSLPSGYQWAPGNNGEFIFNGGSHTFYIIADPVDDTINFQTGFPANSNTGTPSTLKTIAIDKINGVFGESKVVIAPKGFHFFDGSLYKIVNLDGSTYSFTVVSNDVIDKIVFNDLTHGHSFSHYVPGTYGTTGHINPPAHYIFMENSPYDNSFPFDGGTYVFDIQYDPSVSVVSDEINFNGDSIDNLNGSSDHHLKLVGNKNSVGYAHAPANYHFINNENGKFTFNGDLHTFDVAPDQIYLQPIFQNHNQGEPIPVDVSSDDDSKFVVNNNTVQLPSDYVLANDSTSIAFGNDNYDKTFDINVVPETVSDMIVFLGDTSQNMLKKGYINSSDTVVAPKGYHFINGNTGKFIYSGVNHFFNVVPNNIEIQFQCNGNDVGTPVSVDTHNVQATMFNDVKAEIPNSNDYSLDPNSPKSLDFMDNGDNYLYKIALKANSVTDKIIYNNDKSADFTTQGFYNSSDTVSAPNGFQFINIPSDELFDRTTQQKFDHKTGNIANEYVKYVHNGGTHSFDVAPAKFTLVRDQIDYLNTKGNILKQANIVPKSSYSYMGPVVNDDCPTNYHILDNKYSKMQFGNKSQTLYVTVVGNTMSDQIIFNNDTEDNHKVSGAYNDEGHINPPSGYHFINNEDGNFIYNGGTHIYDILPNQVQLQPQANGQNVSNPITFDTSSLQSDQFTVTKDSLSFPAEFFDRYYLQYQTSSYNITNGGYNQIFDISVIPRQVIDQIRFNGDSLDDNSDTGNYGTEGQVNVPSKYHLIDGEKGLFRFDGGTHTFDVAPNEILAQFQSDGQNLPNVSPVVIDTSKAKSLNFSIQMSRLNIPSGYYSPSTVIPITLPVNNGFDHVYNIQLQQGTPNATEKIIFAGDSSANTKMLGSNGFSDTVAAPSDYHYINGSTGQFTFSDKSQTFNVAPNEIKVQLQDNGVNVGPLQTVDTSDSTGNMVTINNSDITIPSNYKLKTNNSNNNYPINFGDNSYDQIFNVPLVANSVTNPIVVNGDSALNNPNNRGSYNSQGHIAVPSTYHLINDETNQYTFGVNGAKHIFDVVPNEIKVQFEASDGQGGLNSVGSIETIDTSNCNSSTFNINDQTANVPAYTELARPNNVIAFGDEGYDNVFYIKVKSLLVQTALVVNGDSALNNPTNTGNYNTTGHLTVPNGYHLINGENPDYKFDGNTHTFDVAPNEIKVQFVYNDGQNHQKNIGQMVSVNTSGVNGTSYDITANDVKIPDNYNLITGDNDEDFGDQGLDRIYKIAVAPADDTDTVIFEGAPTGDNLSMRGTYGTDSGNITAPSGYHFTDGETNESFTFNGGMHYFSVSNIDTDSIVFDGDTAANESVDGADKSAGQVNAPAGYHFIDKDTGAFTFNGGTHTFHVAKDTPSQVNDTETIKFTYSDGTPEKDKTQTGIDGSTGSVTAPHGYHFVDQNGNSLNTETFQFSKNGSVVFALAKNVKEGTVTIVYNGDPNDSYSITGSDGSTGYVGMPEGYRFSDYAEQHTFKFDGGTHVFNVVKLVTPQEVTDHVVYNGDPSANFTVSGMSGTTGYINTLKGYYFADGSEQEQFTFDGGTHTVQVIPFTNPNQPVMDTDTVEYVGDPAANFTVKGVAGSTGYINTLQGYYFTDGSEQEHFTFNGGVHKAYVKPFTSPTPSLSVPSESNEVGAMFEPNLDNHPTVKKSNAVTKAVKPIKTDATNSVKPVQRNEVQKTEETTNNQDHKSNQVSVAKEIAKPIQNKQQTTVTPKKTALKVFESDQKSVGKKQSVVETVQFTGANDSAVQIKGSKGTQTSVVAPKRYHYANGDKVQPVTFDGQKHILPVIKDKNN